MLCFSAFIEEVLYDLNEATVFSKISLKWEFHLIKPEEDSRAITTFITYRGLNRYRPLMFGIMSAPEKYQKMIYDVSVSQLLCPCEYIIPSNE